jgi:hypothetical protein
MPADTVRNMSVRGRYSEPMSGNTSGSGIISVWDLNQGGVGVTSLTPNHRVVAKGGINRSAQALDLPGEPQHEFSYLHGEAVAP